jgi:hypothetical protein
MAFQHAGVQPLTVVDKSDNSPSRLTFPLNSPYSPFSEGNSPSPSLQTRRMLREYACVFARVLAHRLAGAAVCPLLAPSWSSPIENSLYWLLRISVRKNAPQMSLSRPFSLQ